jgi:drug/metabolite transporter (DMT)-like permease
MTFAVVLTIFASFLWGITNHIDKFMISGIDESGSSVKTLLVFSTLVAGIILSPIWLIASKFSIGISNVSLLCVLLSSFVYILATYFYFKALEKNDASIVVVMFQLIPVFSYILALIFFKENLALQQIIGSILIILSAVLISFDFEERNNKSKWLALILMALSSLLYATYFFLFDIGIRNSSYNSCAFWLQIGFLIQGIILICFKNYRSTFIETIKNNGKKYFSLNITNEAINLIANLLVNFTNVTIPLALANVLNGFQGAFVFILGVIGVKLLPKYFKENINKKIVVQKISCIIISIVGLIIMFV